MTDTREFREITVPAHTIIASRETIPTSEMRGYFDRAFGQAAGALAEAGVRPVGAARAYYFSDLAETVDLAGGFPVPADAVDALEESVPELLHHVPESRVITTRHLGSYDSLAATWQETVEHVRDLGLETGLVFWEEYVTMPTPEADPAEMITDIFITVQ